MSTQETDARLRIEKCAAEIRRLARQSGGVPEGGWLRAMRVAAGTPQGELAAKLGCKRQAWPQFEGSEARGAISLASLRRTADALDCDFVYFVVPRRSAARRASPAAEPVVAPPAEVVSAEPAPDRSTPDLPTELL
jgi:transcriptional regulator with XRE-family HTH domain